MTERHRHSLQAFVPFFDECQSLIVALLPADQLPGFQTLASTCLAIDPTILWGAVAALSAQGCVLREHAAPAPPTPWSGALSSPQKRTSLRNHAKGSMLSLLGRFAGHRRTQGLNFHHGLSTAECPMDSFTERVASIDATCCTQVSRATAACFSCCLTRHSPILMCAGLHC